MCTSLSRRGCRFTVTLRIEFENNSGLGAGAFQALVDGWESDIDGMWNGPTGSQTFRCCTVTFNVITRVGADTANFHQIEVVGGPQTSFVNSLGPGCSGGRWDALDTGNVAAHESGHLLGLPDEYDYNGPGGSYQNLNPQPTDPQSIMAQTWGSVAALQEHIDAILSGLGARCPWWCCILRWLRRWIDILFGRRSLKRTVDHRIVDELREWDMGHSQAEQLEGLPSQEVLQAVTDGRPHTLAMAVHVLAERGRDEVPQLVQALENDDVRVRWVAAAALGEIGDETAVRDLTGALRDENASVRVQAAASLVSLGSREGIPTLIQELTNTDVFIGHPPVRIADHADQVLQAISGERFGEAAPDQRGLEEKARRWEQWWREQAGGDRPVQ